VGGVGAFILGPTISYKHSYQYFFSSFLRVLCNFSYLLLAKVTLALSSAILLRHPSDIVSTGIWFGRPPLGLGLPHMLVHVP
jgi:hypothetical protein